MLLILESHNHNEKVQSYSNKLSSVTKLLGFIFEVQALGKFLVDPYNKEAYRSKY